MTEESALSLGSCTAQTGPFLLGSGNEMKDMWDERYARDEYAYGEEPNAFFKDCLDRFPAPGRLLLPAEGEGRNAVYAARQGWKVDAFDFSAPGRDKALRLAARHQVQIDYQLADYQSAELDSAGYDAVALIFAHVHEDARRSVHRRMASALASGGQMIVEAYSKEQLGYGTGGPPVEALLYNLDDLRGDFPELEILQLERTEAEIREGRYHTGLASVIRLLAVRN